MKGLTKRQREVVDFIDEFIHKNHFSPSYRDIMAHFGFSSLGSVHCHLKILRRKGFVSQEDHCSRSITLTKHQQSTDFQGNVECSLIGHLSANSPIETFPQIQSVALPSFLVPNPEMSYVLRARGDSLVEENIADGDLIIVETVTDPQPGDTVVALIEGSHTAVKRYYPEGPHIRLRSCSAQTAPLLLQADKVLIRGVVVAILRLYS